MDEVVTISQPHHQYYEKLFHELNPGGVPTVGAAEAANFLKRSNLSPQVLGQIWEIADYQKRGSLDRRGIFIAFKLVAASQQGHPVQPAAIHLQGLQPPVFSSVGGSHQSTPTHSVAENQWAIDTADQVKYDSIFDSLSPVDGKLPGAKVRPVLLNSGLNPNSLAKIWELADQDKDGQLDRVEMAVALHLVYRTLQNEPVPPCLPPSLVHPSKTYLSRRSSTASQPYAPQSFNQMTFGGMNAGSRAGSVASLDGIGMTTPVGGPPADRSMSAQPMAARNTSARQTPVQQGVVPPGGDWPVDRATSAAQFAVCDTNSDGIVNGADVRHVLMGTGLPQQVLAHIWELADINKNGTLNQEQFALVIHFINAKKRGEELPTSLPAQLVPPSMRKLSLNESHSTDVLSDAPICTVALDQATKSENAEVRQLAEEMEKLLIERREADAQVVQLEADMTVKNSAIRNLQIELQTLEGTVKQLERQKAEAGRRLGDLDEQIKQLVAAGEAQAAKGVETSARLEQLKADAEEGSASVERDHATMAEAREELVRIEAEGRNLGTEISSQQRAVETSIDELTKAERELERDEKQVGNIKEASEKLRKLVGELQTIVDSEDAPQQLKQKLTLLANMEDPRLFQDAPFNVASTSAQNSVAQPPDPFAGTQSGLAQVDPFAQTDPFSGNAASGAFGGGFPADPFNQTGNAFGSAGPQPAAKAPPPRPAPPKTNTSARQTPIQDDPFANVDPFASQPTNNATGGFADFSSFSSFS